ncbi:hypothetical protein [Solirhodobacter olei]|uniref:hypothetical protein n=1 Tax=Solirhodobacter olei TaxID=2493082 RepID=UPI000FD75271|nr:hypothetical protein [Solirhodobacter olei]
MSVPFHLHRSAELESVRDLLHDALELAEDVGTPVETRIAIDRALKAVCKDMTPIRIGRRGPGFVRDAG